MEDKYLNPKFSFIVPHYDEVITDEQFLEGMSSIAESTYKNYEVRIYHDGPMSRSLPDLDQFGFEYSVKETKKRYNDWGHSLRDLGIREAEGDYIVHFNPDNILFPEALQGIVEILSFSKSTNIHEACNNVEKVFGVFDNCYELIVCPIILEGVIRFPNGSLTRTRVPEHKVILDGFPTIHHNVDCMQLVASKNAWLSIGGWHNKSETSDGLLAQELHHKYKCLYSQRTIGIHR